MTASAAHVFATLRLVMNSPAPLGVTELSRIMGLPTTTVHRALMTLEHAGFVGQNAGSSKYQPGMMPQHLVRALFNRFKIDDAALPFLRRISESSNCTVALSVRVGWTSMRISIIESESEPMHLLRLGEIAPLYGSVSGKCLLAFLAETAQDQFRAFLQQTDKLLDETLRQQEFWPEIAAIRKRGYAIGSLRISPAHAVVAFPVRHAASGALATISVVRMQPATAAAAGVRQWFSIRDELEALIAADPERFENPFAHLDPDSMTLRVTDPT